MEEEKRSARELIGKTVMSKGGRKFGEVKDIIFETKNGELMHVVLKNPTKSVESINTEQSKDGEIMIRFDAVTAMGDFLVIDESEL
ncbi:PRC-barrel domain-containing protein [Nanoarchaeota archaeon]